MAKPTKSPSKLNEATAVPSISAADKKRQMQYMAEDAIRTLTRAEEIKKDKQLMSHVKRHAQTIAKVCKK